MQTTLENYIPNNSNYKLYQLPCWKTYKDEETGEELIINILDIKYMKSHINRIQVLDGTTPIEYRDYIIYVRVDQAVTDEIKVSKSIYRQIEKDLEVSE